MAFGYCDLRGRVWFTRVGEESDGAFVERLRQVCLGHGRCTAAEVSQLQTCAHEGSTGLELVSKMVHSAQVLSLICVHTTGFMDSPLPHLRRDLSRPFALSTLIAVCI